MLNAPPDAAAETLLQGPARVVDGDTLYIGSEKVRLFGLDAPESKQQCTDSGGRPYACGQVSAQALEARIQSRPVTCAVKNKDQYGRNVAACSLGSEDIGAWMVKNGHAVAYKCAPGDGAHAASCSFRRVVAPLCASCTHSRSSNLGGHCWCCGHNRPTVPENAPCPTTSRPPRRCCCQGQGTPSLARNAPAPQPVHLTK
jgi:hypothetical protein